MYSLCLKEFGTDCLVHVVLTLSWPHSLFFEVQHMKVLVTSLGCQRHGMFLFISFQTQPYPHYFYPGENQTKVAEDKTTVLTAVQGSCSKSQDFPSIATSTSTLQSRGLSCPLHWPCSNLAGLCWLLEFFFHKQKQLDYKNEACDLWRWSPNKRWFCIPVKGSAAVSSCWCFQVLLPSIVIPVDALASKGKLHFSAGLERPSIGVERDAECCSKLFLLWCL